MTLENVSLAYGLDSLLNHVKLQINKNERICLLGRNGAGKSSLLKIVEGTLMPDSGSVWRKPELRLARLAQELPVSDVMTVYEYVAGGLAETGDLLAKYHTLTQNMAQTHSLKDIRYLDELQSQIDAKGGWQLEQQINNVITRLDLNADEQMCKLSGGWQRRAALAKVFVSSPELILLDEPTNHLDIEAIEWLEHELMNCGTGLLFITHDRALLQRIATRILELDRGQLTSWPGDYENFLRRKEEMLHAEEMEHAKFDKKLAQEEQWIRQGIKARRTRNEGRVRALIEMRKTRARRREVQGKADFNLNAAQQSGQLVVEATNVSHCFDHQPVIDHFSVRIMRGDRVGLIGPNGIGKSTLLNILLGNIIPQQGKVTIGTKLQIAYFDQLRQSLDLTKTVIDNVMEGSEYIEINGQKQHIMSYLNEFLFTPARARTPVKSLSGGECNRLLLARLFSQPANLLVLDEPTNDLDIETLELLEDLLANYQGTLLLVSHDRAFLDNVVTSTLVFEGQGKITEYVGGYHDWLLKKEATDNQELAKIKKQMPLKLGEPKKTEEKIRQSHKLSYKEQRELAELPNKIETLEAKQNALQQQVASTEFYKQDAEHITQTLSQLNQLNTDIEHAYRRWEELEALAKSFKQ